MPSDLHTRHGDSVEDVTTTPQTVRIALAVDMAVDADLVARIEAVDHRIDVVQPSAHADPGDGAWSAARDRAEVLLTPTEAVFGSARIAMPADIDAVPRAEFAMSGFLAFAKNLPGLITHEADRRQPGAPMGDLRDRTLLVIGLGATGREVVRLGHAFGMRVLAVNRTGRTDCPHIDTIRTTRFLGDLLPVSHYVALALPLTDQTRGVIDAGVIGHLRSDAVLANVGHGGVLDEHAATEALEQRRLTGAVFDGVASADFASDSVLWTLPNVVISPDDAARTASATRRIVENFIPNLRRHLAGEALLGQVSAR